MIELQGDRGKAMEQANQEMAGHCGPNNFTITQEGEEAVGTDTIQQQNTSEDTAVSKNGRRSATDTASTNTTSTRTATAWRVHYQCNNAGAPPPAGGPPPAGDPNAPPPAAPPPGGPGY